MGLREIMEAFAAEVGVTDAKPDEMGSYHFNVDGMIVTFVEAGENLVTWAEVGEVPPVGHERFYRMLMESMFLGEQTAGGSFSIDPDSGKVYLQRFDALAALTLESFKAILEPFFDALEKWHDDVADFRDLAPDLENAEEAAAGESREFDLGSFMRV